MLARRFGGEALRFITQKGSYPKIQDGREDGTMEAIVKSLGVLPDHNVKAFLGVEGKNDISFLRIISKMLCENNIDGIPDLKEAEDSRELIIIPLGGSNLDLWASRLEGIGRPEFYLVDSDMKGDPKVQKLQQRENCTVWVTKRRELENYIHPKVIKCCYPALQRNIEVAQRMFPHCLLKLYMRLAKVLKTGKV